jgi:hypothetical protein
MHSLCVSGSIFTHKVTNSEINSITNVYCIESYYKTYYKTKRSKQRNKEPHHKQMIVGPHAKNRSSSSEQQSIAAIYMKYGKCEYIKYSTSARNNDMQGYNTKGLTTWFN